MARRRVQTARSSRWIRQLNLWAEGGADDNVHNRGRIILRLRLLHDDDVMGFERPPIWASTHVDAESEHWHFCK
jgi:hypothetical protein